MNVHRNDIRPPRRGFALVEILIVIGIVTLLMSISYAAFSSALGSARQRATQATLLKLNGLLQQRVDAFNRQMDRTNLIPSANKMMRDIQSQVGFGVYVTPTAAQILTRKQIYQNRFPQSFYENPSLISSARVTYNASKHVQTTESAALLYWIVTQSEFYGIAPVDQSDFTSSEVRDTDGDGLLEFVDGWGHPLRFYRWPTNLFRSGYFQTPGNSPVIYSPGVSSTSPLTLTPVDPSRTFANVLWFGLPATSTNAGVLGDPLARDPDDPTGELSRMVLNSSAPATVLTMLQNRFHTPDTYNAFLIVSAGADNKLGLGEPYDFSGSGGAPDTWNATTSTYTLASSSPALLSTPGPGRLASLLSYSTPDNAINDNITNRKR